MNVCIIYIHFQGPISKIILKSPMFRHANKLISALKKFKQRLILEKP